MELTNDRSLQAGMKVIPGRVVITSAENQKGLSDFVEEGKGCSGYAIYRKNPATEVQEN